MSDCWKCDKCGRYFETGKPYEVRSYEGNTRSGACAHKSYDLCEECKQLFDKWIEEKKKQPVYAIKDGTGWTTISYVADGGLELADDVNHPKHYDNGKVECIDWIKLKLTPEEFKGYLKGCALKYQFRYEDKANPAKDLQKARWYLKKLEELA